MKYSRREFKLHVLELLRREDNLSRRELTKLPTKRLISALTPLLLNEDHGINQSAITAMGEAVARLAEEDLEAARVAVRTHIWNLMEESGNCPTGSPEMIGACLAGNRQLAEEFTPMLISYIMPDGNFLDHEPLLISALKGIGRLAEVRPQILEEAIPYLEELCESDTESIQSLSKMIFHSLK